MRDCDNPNPKARKLFEAPVLQTLQMFMGEMLCWLIVGLFNIYKKYFAKPSLAQEGGYTAIDTQEEGVVDSDGHSIMSNTPTLVKTMSTKEDRIPLVGRKVFMLALPAVCDIVGTTLMNVGLLFVVPSIYQMTRGALVLFVGLFSVIFLKRRLHLFQWFALFTVVLGVAIVGLAGALYKDHKAASTAVLMLRAAVKEVAQQAHTPETLKAIIGVCLIAGAQIFTAFQFVLEEFILEKYALEPLKIVGWEGIFGFSVTTIAMLVMYAAVGRTQAGRFGYWDLAEGWRQITSYRPIGVSSILIMISIGHVSCSLLNIALLISNRGFNFFGLSVTHTVSATARSTIDTCRTLFIWIVSLFLGWESFKWLQVVGFGLLVYGTFLFNGLVRPPLQRCVVRDVEELLPEEPIEHN